MRPLPLLLAALLLLPASAAAAPLKVKRGTLVDGRGRTVVLHGVNVAYKVAPYHPNGTAERTSFDREDVARLRSWGMNSIRLGVTWKALEPAPGQLDEAYVAEIVRLTRLAARRGLYVLVDMHQDEWSERYRGNGAPEWATLDDGIPFPPTSAGHPYDYTQPAVGRAFTSFWENRDGIRSRFVAAFARLARELRREDGVVGYDAFNEPSCEIQRAPCGLPPDPTAGDQWLRPFYEELVPAMRAADPRHPVFYEDFLTTAFGYPYTIAGTLRRGQGLSYHVYCPHPLRSERSCDDLEREALERSVTVARAAGVAPLLTEFGATDDLAVVGRIAALADQAGQSWHYWQYKTYFDPTTSARTSPGASADAESIVDEGGAVKADKLRVLARAFPERLAGRAARWSFDPAIGAFDLRYTARRRGRSAISLPVAVHYGRGYRVRVNGGRRVSRRNARRLVVRATTSRVRVRVSPR
jgi:endoglycosylceramidase